MLAQQCQDTCKRVVAALHTLPIINHDCRCRKAFVTSQPKLDFLADKFAAVPDYVEDEVTKEAPVKKQRYHVCGSCLCM